MGVIQRRGELQCQHPDLRPCHWPVFLTSILQGSAIAKLHRIIENLIGQGAVIHRSDARVVQPADGAGLAKEALGLLVILLAAAIEQILANHLKRADPTQK